MIVGDASLTYQVIGKAMESHNELGPGLDEIIYHRLLSIKLAAAGIAHEFKPKGRLIHRGQVADVFECDLLLPGRLIPELKVLEEDFVPDHYTQSICYLKFWSVDTALLFDFGKENLIFRRIRYEPFSPPPLDFEGLHTRLPRKANQRLASTVCRSLQRIYTTYGLGYRDSTYHGLVLADLQADGVSCGIRPRISIRQGDNTHLGESGLDCVVVEEHCALKILALKDTIRPRDQAVLRSYLRHLHLPWGLVANFGKKALHLTLVINDR